MFGTQGVFQGATTSSMNTASNANIGGGGGGNALGLINGMNQGMSSFGEAMQYQGMATANDLNASLLELDAKMVMADSEFTAKRMEEKGEGFMGKQAAMFAKSGVTMDGSVMHVAMNSEKNIRMDILTMKYNAVRKANALGFQALNAKIQAGQARTRAVMKMGQGVLKMASSAAMASGGTA